MKPSRYTEEMIKRNFENGYWDSFTISHYWERNARQDPDRELLVDSTRRLTGTELLKYM